MLDGSWKSVIESRYFDDCPNLTSVERRSVRADVSYNNHYTPSSLAILGSVAELIARYLSPSQTPHEIFHLASMGRAALTTVAGKAVGPVGYGMLGR